MAGIVLMPTCMAQVTCRWQSSPAEAVWQKLGGNFRQGAGQLCWPRRCSRPWKSSKLDCRLSPGYHCGFTTMPVSIPQSTCMKQPSPLRAVLHSWAEVWAQYMATFSAHDSPMPEQCAGITSETLPCDIKVQLPSVSKAAMHASLSMGTPDGGNISLVQCSTASSPQGQQPSGMCEARLSGEMPALSENISCMTLQPPASSNFATHSSQKPSATC
mmetsp:Transcript_60971/g.199636  ORF Transcript_60971/g.199636 Transcript_60971/m.199636 type:complete len:215 (+) Transcript_60971:379-1023(+)